MASRQRLLLIAPPNSYRTVAYLEAAKHLGVDMLVASQGEHALVPGLAGGLHVDLSQPEALDTLLAAAAERPFAGVVATDDVTVELCARVAEALGLSHNPPQAARLSRRKDLARHCLQAAGVPVPSHRLLDLTQALRPQLADLDYPCVVKPLALSGSRGVIRADDEAALIQAVGRIQAMLVGERQAAEIERQTLLVERFIKGPELAVEGMLHRGELRVLAVFDKPDPLQGPFFEETYYITPSRHDPATLARVEQRVAAACAAYGLREGPVHAELRLARDDAWIMEIASRTIGGQCGQLLRFGTGTGLEELVIAQAMGQALPVKHDCGAAGVLMIPIPEAGVLRRVEGVLAAQQVPYIESLEISLREGYRLVPLPEGASYLGFIFARAPSPQQAEQALREAHACLAIRVAPWFEIQGAG